MSSCWKGEKRNFPETLRRARVSSSSFVMVQSEMEVGVQFHCGVRLQLPKPALRLSVKKQDDVHSCAGDRRNHSGASASESPASCPPSETPGCAAEGGLTDEQHSA